MSLPFSCVHSVLRGFHRSLWIYMFIHATKAWIYHKNLSNVIINLPAKIWTCNLTSLNVSGPFGMGTWTIVFSQAQLAALIKHMKTDGSEEASKLLEDLIFSIVFPLYKKKHGSVQSIFDGSLSNFWSAYLPRDIWWHHHHMLNKEMHFIDQHQTQVKLFNVGTANHRWHLKPWCCCNGKCHYQDRVSTTWAYLRPRSQSHLAQHLRTWGTMNFLAAGVRFVRRFWVLVCVMKLTNIHWDALPTRMQSWPPWVLNV